MMQNTIRNKEIIVTGGAGFIGTNLVRTLAVDNEVTVVDNLHTGSEDNLRDLIDSKQIKVIKDDVKNIGKYKLQSDLVFHLGFPSASPMYRNDPQLVSEVAKGMISILEYCKDNSTNLVYSSTSSIYNGVKPPHREDIVPGVTDFYTEARIYTERLSKLYNDLFGINVVAMRFFSIYGKYEKAKGGYANLVTQFLWNIRDRQEPVIYGDGEQRRDFIYVEDLVESLLLASKIKGCEVFNVGYGKNYSLNEMLAMLNHHLGTDVKAKYIEMPVKNYVMETLADTTKSEKVLGFKAKTTLEDGIRIISEFYR
ncbi:MAG: NAD-dependent epimerase/dehydratase family protein [Cuniculiplasma sp.]